MKASTKRALIYLSMLVIGYAIGFFDGAPPAVPISVGPLLLALFLAPLIIAKFAGWLIFRFKRGQSGSSGSGEADFPLVPRPPVGRPPVLTGHEQAG